EELDVDIGDGADAPRRACVVDEAIDAAVPVERAADERFDLPLAAHVGAQKARRAPETSSHRFASLGAPPGDDDPCPLLDDALRRARPNAARATRHGRDLPLENPHRSPPCDVLWPRTSHRL